MTMPTGRARNRDTLSVNASSCRGDLALCLYGRIGGNGDGRARELTMAPGRVAGA